MWAGGGYTYAEANIRQKGSIPMEQALRPINLGSRVYAQVTAFAAKIVNIFSHAEDTHTTAAHLLETYGDAMLRMAYSYLHNNADAEEVVQDVLIQYLKETPTFNGPVHEKAWCLRVAANLSKNRIKYNNVRRADELNDELVAEEREDLSFVWEAVKALPEKYREVIHLFYQEGYSTAEVARILGRNEATVRSHLARGREQLKTILKEAYDFE